ncbi:beta-phosphoglucomutase family hydrolase [Herbiconiux sp. KACC 21604]|uniref:HAD family hydrolase n=1 Tax=unclassified Herbiconiux TaxID=2618217 RepID=UPI001492C174|nr:beta-phosphoglucomutase family hydrolase [Herbiconiux sp. SALV-R1]QJU55560.1 beta-phosphoglucomutase family hydrolase [Herbiconiux sp. SALV-R1]WPO86751.1 beta-phosphoglucomutase family hydrolase [Herbiconiux sp. KACC 21604]
MTDTVTRDASRLATARALLFDLDGVLTPTVDVHMKAWARLFTPYLASQGVAPYTDDDYYLHIDGKPRVEGVRSMLEARGLSLPSGSPDDAAGESTVWALGNRKNDAVAAELAENGVEAYPGSLEFLTAALEADYEVAVVSSSRNAEAVLTAAGIRDRFEVIVDGLVAAREGIAGKPAPDTYLRAAELLGFTAAECVVIEDAHSGVQAGRDGDFGLVVGVDRGVGAEELLGSGADIVVDDLAELVPALR